MDIPAHALTALAAYLVGSIPTGYIVARAKGVDIRAVGSGNIGATNAFRTLGRWAGSLVLTLDFLKGVMACTLVADGLYRTVGAGNGHDVAPESLALVAGVCAVLGHNYTCWLRFKGGKGIATSAGVLVALVPRALLIILGVWIVVFAASRYVSLASVAASLALPLAVLLTHGSPTLLLITSALTVLAVYKHRPNIRRLLARTEHRFGSGVPPPPP